MNKTIQLKDFIQWQEKKRNCIEETVVSAIASASPPAATTTTSTWRTVGTAGTTRARTIPRSASVKRRRPPIFIKLAEESTPHGAESDDSTYNSLNEAETDFCRDESDYSDGYVTDGFATMDVIEYEVDDSSSSEDLYTHGSSSGTDDLVVAAAVARALFEPSSSGSEHFEILADDADTEESDAPTDPELGRADYWTCIKCKNQNNHPMYRFCEKCYQIRKTHFPPRPKHRRKRSAAAKRLNGNNNANKLSGVSSPSSPSSTASLSATEEKRDDGRLSRNSSDGSDDIGKFLHQSNSSRKSRARRSSIKQKHSAGESSCCSSQELSPDEQQSTLPPSRSNYLAACASSQETYCSEIEKFVNAKKQKTNLTIFENNYPNSQESIYPNSEEFSRTSPTNSIEHVYENARSLSKVDSLTSTTSGYASEQQSTQSLLDRKSQDFIVNVSSVDSNGNQQEQRSCGGTGIATKKAKKRKNDFSDEISDSEVDDDELIRAIANKKFKTMDDENDSTNGMCIICLTKPKNGAFVHNRFLHVCCCYSCTVKVWNKRKRCPICNSHVKTVLKMFVH